MAQPGPRQVFPANIVRISFPTVGGLVYFRVSQRFNGEVTPPEAIAMVKGLPWGDFNMFSVAGQNELDPNGTPANEQVPIANPITTKMLSKYLYWAHWPKAHGVKTEQLDGYETVVLDTAQWALVYAGHITNRLSPIMSREDALAMFQGLVGTTGYENMDPTKMGVTVVKNDYSEYTQEELIATANLAGWTYHIETVPGVTIYTVDDVASIVINLAKLFRDVPKVNGKTPPTFTFQIEHTVRTFAAGKGELHWQIDASTWIPKVDNPPKEFQRLDFPVQDVVVPISGIPGAFNTNYSVPTFPHPDSEVALPYLEKDQVVTINCTITFGAGNTVAEVEFEYEGGGVEEG